MASRKRISLGSGLNRSKLADTIVQMRAPNNDLPPRLVGNAVEYPHGWSQLSIGNDGWILRAGCPHPTVPNEIITLPPEAIIREFVPSLFIEVLFDIKTSPDILADFMEQVIIEVQGLSMQDTIQFALES